MNRKGHKYILRMVDHFSKRAKVRPLRKKEAFEIMRNIGELIDVHGPPKTILTDNGEEFAFSEAEVISKERMLLGDMELHTLRQPQV